MPKPTLPCTESTRKYRISVFESKLEAIVAALAGDPVEYEGRRFRVTPRSVQRPRPPVLVGGASPASARRAARFGDGFSPGSQPAFGRHVGC
ncbi:LLM class flavin-dependent oxidoreductase [Rhodococcus sp. IEGM 1366]|uniref:LLM class flavin-dependent oxidoreductase n=1 Tax=Rhodococcus sp. IEGM 1366 TaxID=3082223 RepID=UPI0039892415